MSVYSGGFETLEEAMEILKQNCADKIKELQSEIEYFSNVPDLPQNESLCSD